MTPSDGPKFENFTFTAISAAIFKRSDRREFSTTIYLREQIPTGSWTWTPGFSEIENGPTFYLRPIRDGYEFGVQVQEAWWKLHKELLTPLVRDLTLRHRNELVLGLLPYGYMPDHVRRWNEPVSLWYRFDSKQRQWKKRLQKHGWAFSDDYPSHITHRYLGISFNDI